MNVFPIRSTASETANSQVIDYRDHKDIRLIKEMFNRGAFFNDDKLTVRAQQTVPANQSASGKQEKFPFAENWQKSPVLKRIGNGSYYNHYTDKFLSASQYNQLGYREQQDCTPCQAYELNKAALHYMEPGTDKSILTNIRLLITSNQIDIILTGLLIERFPESRLKLIIEAIRALNKAGVIGGIWKNTTAQSRPYAIFKKCFKVCDYEIAFNAGRYGKRLCELVRTTEASQKLKAINKRDNQTFNKGVVYADTTFKEGGVQISAYDKYLVPKNTASGIGQESFPYRLEVLLRRKFFKKAKSLEYLLTSSELIKGNPQKIIQRFQDELWKALFNGIKHMKAGIDLDIFINTKKTSKDLRQSFNELLKTRSFADAASQAIQDRYRAEQQLRKEKDELKRQLESKSTQLEEQSYLVRLKDEELNKLTIEFSKYHGRDLHQHRGASPL
jgi:hypothetical protein